MPWLEKEPVIGSGLGCCVVLAEDAVRDAVLEIPGVRAVEVGGGRVRVVFDPELASAGEIGGALESLGYPPEGVICDVEAEG